MTNPDSLYGTYPCPYCGRYVKPPYCPFCGGEIRKPSTLKEAMERLITDSNRCSGSDV